MSANLDLKELDQYLGDQVQKIKGVYAEVEEIQVGFNSAYVTWKADHDASIAQITELVESKWEELGAELQDPIATRQEDEGEALAARREELREVLIPETQAQADAVHAQGVDLTARMRELNPELDEREETVKAARVTLTAQLNDLNQQIKELSGCLLLVNYFKIFRLDKERQRVIGRLQAAQDLLKKIREEWQESVKVQAEEEANLRSEWERLTLELARLQGELAYLDEETNLAALAKKRAIRYTLDNLKTSVGVPVPELQGELERMIQLNIQTDDYQAGLGEVSGLLGMLEGVMEGLKRFRESVGGLIDEQRMHSAHLPMIRMALPPEVTNFNRSWEGLEEKMRDEARYQEKPTAFLEVVEAETGGWLHTEAIKSMFETMGQMLNKATEAWN